MTKLSNYLLNEETNEFCIHLLTLLPEIHRGHDNIDDVLEELSEYHGMSKEEVNHKLLKLLFNMLTGTCQNDLIGKHNNINIDELDQEEYRKGCLVEFEHTNDHFIAACIARDHLSEFADYYSRLEKMEQEAKS